MNVSALSSVYKTVKNGAVGETGKAHAHSASQTSETSAPRESTNKATLRESVRNVFGRHDSFTTLLSRASPTRSDEAILEAARKQARIDFANGVFQVSEGFGELNREFVSSVSPDRAGMMRNAMRASPFPSSQQRRLELWEILLKLEKGTDALPVSSLKRTPTGAVESMIIVDAQGNPIINFAHDRGWIEVFTPAEATRAKEILQVYNEEWLTMRDLAKSESNRFEQIPSDLGVGALFNTSG